MEQSDLFAMLHGWDDDQQAGMTFDMLEKPQKIAPIVGDKREIATNDLWQQGAITIAKQAGIMDVRSVIPALVRVADEIGGQAFIKQKADQSLPSASAQRRTASTPPKGRDG